MKRKATNKEKEGNPKKSKTIQAYFQPSSSVNTGLIPSSNITTEHLSSSNLTTEPPSSSNITTEHLSSSNSTTEIQIQPNTSGPTFSPPKKTALNDFWRLLLSNSSVDQDKFA